MNTGGSTEFSQRGQILQWVLAQCERLRSSKWSSQLEVESVDVLDAAVAYFVYDFQRKTSQEQPATARKDAFGRRLLRVLRTKRQEIAAARVSARVDAKTCPIVFWPREPTHVRPQVEVARVLAERGVTYQFVACQAKIAAALIELSETPVFAQAITPTWKSAEQTGREAATWLNEHAPDCELEPLEGLSREQQIATFRRVLTTTLPVIHRTLAALQEIRQRFQPEVVVVGNDLSLEGRTAALSLADATETKVATLMHGIVKQSNALHRLHLVDQFLAHGQQARDVLLSLGMSAATIEVTGAPYLDPNLKQTGEVDARLREKLGLTPDKPWVLVATSGPGDSVSEANHRATIEALARAATELPEVTFVVKLHRKDRLSFYSEAVSRLPASRLRVIPFGERGWPREIFAWLQGCPLVITGGSTVAVEAMLLSVPVVTIDLRDELAGLDLLSAGATRHVTEATRLTSEIESVLHDGLDKATETAAQAYVESFFGPQDGLAARRCAKVICSLSRSANLH